MFLIMCTSYLLYKLFLLVARVCQGMLNYANLLLCTDLAKCGNYVNCDVFGLNRRWFKHLNAVSTMLSLSTIVPY